jgi:type I restriction enzyme S subunit
MNKVLLREICNLHSGGTPSTKNPEYWNGNLTWLSSAESSKDFIYNSKTMITQKGVNESSTRLATKESVIIATAGEGKTRGQVSFLEIDAYINQSLIAIKSKSKELSNLYIFYYLKNSYERLRNLSNATGVRGSLSGELLKSFEITFPNINNQNKITQILRSIDSKIEVNSKLNSELESMIKTIYEYWFLQFEFPNDEGKPYKSSGGKMVWNEELKREIPNDWEVNKIGDILKKSTKSKVQVSEAKQEGEYPFFTSGESILKHNQFFVEDFNIFLNTGGNPDIKAYFGKSAYSTDTWCVSAGKYSYLLYYYFLKIKPQFEQLFFAGSGLKHLQKDVLKDIYIPLPKEKNLEYFNNFCLNIWKKITNQYKQNQELSSLRDFLLPLLINGQVKFK